MHIIPVDEHYLFVNNNNNVDDVIIGMFYAMFTDDVCWLLRCLSDVARRNLVRRAVFSVPYDWILYLTNEISAGISSPKFPYFGCPWVTGGRSMQPMRGRLQSARRTNSRGPVGNASSSFSECIIARVGECLHQFVLFSIRN